MHNEKKIILKANEKYVAGKFWHGIIIMKLW